MRRSGQRAAAAAAATATALLPPPMCGLLRVGAAPLVPVHGCTLATTPAWTVTVATDSPLGPANAVPLSCFVCCPVSEDKTRWLAAFSIVPPLVEGQHHHAAATEHVHAADLRFPFHLPLYGSQFVLLVAFRASVAAAAAAQVLPLYLGPPPPSLVTDVGLAPLDAKQWEAMGDKVVWDALFPNVRAALCAAFDGLAPSALEDVVDEWEVPLTLGEMDALGVVMASGGPRAADATAAATGTPPAQEHRPPPLDGEEEEDEEEDGGGGDDDLDVDDEADDEDDDEDEDIDDEHASAGGAHAGDDDGDDTDPDEDADGEEEEDDGDGMDVDMDDDEEDDDTDG